MNECNTITIGFGASVHKRRNVTEWERDLHRQCLYHNIHPLHFGDDTDYHTDEGPGLRSLIKFAVSD